MRGGASVWRRTRTLSSLAWKREQARVTSILCELEGVDPEEFVRECAEWEARYKRAGARTLAEQTAVIAAELGVPVDEVEAEAAEIAERAMAIWRQGR